MFSTPIRRCLFSVVFLAGAISSASASAEGSPTLPPATDLKADGITAMQARQPIVILFSLPGCHFCDEVRQNYLLPLLQQRADKRPLLREIVITGKRLLVAFNGESSTETALAARYAVRVGPSVLMLDATGKLLVPPVVGGDTSGLYGGVLANALSDATGQLAGP